MVGASSSRLYINKQTTNNPEWMIRDLPPCYLELDRSQSPYLGVLSDGLPLFAGDLHSHDLDAWQHPHAILLRASTGSRDD
jgi:hypothetical protein